MRSEEPLYLRRVKLSNIRALESLDLSFGDAPERPRRHTVVIGRNGTCKSTLLRAIALGLASKSDVAALLAAPVGGMIGPRGDHASIAVTAEAPSGLVVKTHVELRRWDDQEVVQTTLDNRTLRPRLLCGYGSGRSTFQSNKRSGRPSYRAMDSVISLFDYSQGLESPELVLRQLRDHLPTAYESVVANLLRALGLGPGHQLELTRFGVELSGPTLPRPVPFDGWADGYRITLGWILDLYGWALRADAIDEDGTVRGIVLVDEIEQHLHPSMQATLLPHLAAMLPDVQLVATTHSPLIALGVESRSVVSLQRREDLGVGRAAVPNLDAFSAEDMLVHEELFDTTPYGPETDEKRATYSKLATLEAAARTPEQTQQLKALAHELQAPLRESPDPILEKLGTIERLLKQGSPS